MIAREWSDSLAFLRTPATTVVLLIEPPGQPALLERSHTSACIEFRTESAPATALAQLAAVDCVVSGDTYPSTTGIELLEAVREREPSLPFVLYTSDPSTAAIDAVLDDEWADVQPRDVARADAFLVKRIDRLVDHRRSLEFSRRGFACVETARDGIVLTDADGVVTFINRQFATRLGTDQKRVIGYHWSKLVTPGEAERIESTAITTAIDGWRWTGSCAFSGPNDEPFTALTSLVGLEDASLVFVVDVRGVETAHSAETQGR